MNPETILALVVGLEQAFMGIYQIIINSGLSQDDKDLYIARIIAAKDKVPEPCVGDVGACDTPV